MNTEQYLSLFYRVLDEHIADMIFVYKSQYFRFVEDKDYFLSILDKKGYTLEDINDLLIDYSDREFDDVDLFSIVYKYFSNNFDNDSLKLCPIDFFVKNRLERVPDKIPEFLMLPILSYLVSSSKYKLQARELYGNNLLFLDKKIIDGYFLDFLPVNISLVFEKLPAITTDHDYTITSDDIKVLSSFLPYEDYLLSPEMKKVFGDIKKILQSERIYSYDNMKLYSHFFKLDFPQKCNNDFLYATVVFKNVSSREYSEEELTQISILFHTSLAPSCYLSSDSLEKFTKDFQFNDVLKFIKTVEDIGLTVSDKDLVSLLKKCIGDKDSDFLSIKELVEDSFRQYTHDHFVFRFEDFCSFMNQLNIDFSPYKYDGTKEFDFSTYLMFLTSDRYRRFAGYYEPLMHTKSGQDLFGEMVESNKEKIKGLEELYSDDTYQKYYPYVEKLASLSDYTLDYFLLDFVKEEDWETVRILINWVLENNSAFFSNSIASEDIVERNKQRAIRNVKKFFSETPLKELTEDNISAYWRSLRNPFVHHNVFPMKKDHFRSYTSLIDKRLERLSLPEVRNMELCLSEGKSLIDYIASREYSEEQALSLISIAIHKMPEEKDKLLRLHDELQAQMDIRDAKIKYDEMVKDTLDDVKRTNGILALFLGRDYSSMAQFYEDAASKFGLSPDKVRDILKSFTIGDSELSQAYHEKREAIARMQVDNFVHGAKERARERLESNIDMYGKEAIEVMQLFISSDDKSIGKFCSSFDLSMNDFRFYRNLCRHIDQDTSALVDDKAADIRRKFIGAMSKSSESVAKEMVRCHRNHIPYDMVEHYQKYGYSPSFIGRFALNVHKDKEARIIDQYMQLYPTIFKPISYSELENMKRLSRFSSRCLFLDSNGKISVNYSSSDLVSATDELCKLDIPVTKGTIFSMLNRVQAEKGNAAKIYQKK